MSRRITAMLCHVRVMSCHVMSCHLMLCMHVYIQTCMYICIYRVVLTSEYACTYVYIYICIYIFICIYLWVLATAPIIRALPPEPPPGLELEAAPSEPRPHGWGPWPPGSFGCRNRPGPQVLLI